MEPFFNELTRGMFIFFVFILPPLIIWSSVWKGLALWKAGTNRHLVWFIILFIFNTAGILEIIYLFAVSPRWGQAKQ